MRIYWSGIWYFRQSLLYYPFLWGDCGRCLDVKQKENLYIRNINKPIDIMHRKQWRTLLFEITMVMIAFKKHFCLHLHLQTFISVIFQAFNVPFWNKGPIPFMNGVDNKSSSDWWLNYSQHVNLQGNYHFVDIN